MVDITSERERKEILQSRRPRLVYPGEPLLGGWYTEEEIDVVVKTIRDSMDYHTGFGFMCKEILDFEAAFARYIGTEHAISINGAGGGLDMAMISLDLKPADEVICPACNFAGAHLAIIGRGAKDVLCEVNPRTLNVDPDDVERRITSKTRAIFPVSLCGLSPPLDDLLEIAEEHPNPTYGPPKIIVDAARCCGAEYKGTKVGKKGWMTIFSLHTQKLMTTLGEGGMITTDRERVAKRLRGIRQWGWETGDWGTNYKMTKVQAAVGLVQLRRLDEMIERRIKVAEQRNELLKNIRELTLPFEPQGYKHTYYLYPILVPREWAGEKRNHIMQILRDEYLVGTMNAGASTYKLHRLIKEHTAGQNVPISDEISERVFCVSIHPLMTPEENEYICAAVAEAVERVKRED